VTEDAMFPALAAAATGAAVASVVVTYLVPRPPRALLRTNLRGAEVPAVLGFGISIGALFGILWASAANHHTSRVAWATSVVVAALFAGGAADDLRGDERAKGFSGHFRAASQGRITGGFIKILAGGLAGLAAGFLLTNGRAALEVALLVALTANLFNLLDRAPGRALKVSFVVAVPLLLFGSVAWVVASAGLWGAAAAVFPSDLRERGMLGDTGANPIGGVIGLGLGLTLEEPARLIALALILALNLASEKVSFSQVIERTPILRAFDKLGRLKTFEPKA
jgi:UDP-N-acetylmuramyl pentapeptide phosphotransferase/UDP-N-acetylglucosamine-1-phosphate transferase